MNSNSPNQNLLEIKNLTVDLGTQIVLKDIDLLVRKGSIHAIIGDHGSGKSTLVNVITGVVPKVKGEIIFNGVSLEKHTPRKALKMGIITIFEQDSIIKSMNSYQNIFLNREIKKGLIFNDKKMMKEKVLKAFDFLSIKINPEIPLLFYNSTQQLMVEIAKIICFPTRLLIIDEIFNKLNPEDLERFHFLLSILVERGVTIIYITKNMDEVFKFATNVTILKNGRIVETTNISNLDKMQLVQLTYSTMFSRKDLEESNLQLYYLKNFNDNVINNIPLPLLVIDSKGSIIMMNNVFIQKYKIDKKMYLDKDYNKLLRLTPDKIRLIEKKIRCLESYQYKKTHLAISPDKLEIDIYIIPFLDETNSFIGTIMLFSDSGNKSGIDNQIDQFVMSRFNESVTGLTHEINNPLGIILNYLKLIKTGTSLNLIKENAINIEREVKRIKIILQNFLKFSLEMRESQVKVNMARIIIEVCELIQPTVQCLNLQILLNLDKNISICADENLLKQVILNLLLNATEALSDGGVIKVNMFEKTIKNDLFTVIEISDNGKGIKKENLERIFDPFFTTKKEDEHSGLGLSICKDVVTQLKGFIKVKSTCDVGATFQVLLPSALHKNVSSG